jgi:type VI secretion system protein ImpM
VSAAAPARTRLGLVGKLPAHGDFVRRGDLPASFCGPWDAWLQDGIAAARATIGEARWQAVWDAAPAWRFALPAGACGPEAAAGVLLPSRDAVGRRFPLTLAAVRPADAPGAWPEAWFAALEGAGRLALAAGHDADRLADLLPAPDADAAALPPVADAAAPAPADPLAGFWAELEAAAADAGAKPDAETASPATAPATGPAPDLAAGTDADPPGLMAIGPPDAADAAAAADDPPPLAAPAAIADPPLRWEVAIPGVAAEADGAAPDAPADAGAAALPGIAATAVASGAGGSAPALLPDDAVPPPPALPPCAGLAAAGWWTAATADGTPGLVWPLLALPPAVEFVLLLESEA